LHAQLVRGVWAGDSVGTSSRPACCRGRDSPANASKLRRRVRRPAAHFPPCPPSPFAPTNPYLRHASSTSLSRLHPSLNLSSSAMLEARLSQAAILKKLLDGPSLPSGRRACCLAGPPPADDRPPPLLLQPSRSSSRMPTSSATTTASCVLAASSAHTRSRPTRADQPPRPLGPAHHPCDENASAAGPTASSHPVAPGDGQLARRPRLGSAQGERLRELPLRPQHAARHQRPSPCALLPGSSRAGSILPRARERKGRVADAADLPSSPPRSSPR
jgi:hypothetical protein